MLEVESSAIKRYGLAVLVLALAVAISLPLRGHLEIGYSLVFLVAVIVAGWYGGFGPGLVCAALSVLALAYAFLPPLHSFSLRPKDILPIGLFIIISLLVTIMNGRRNVTEAARRESENLYRAAFELAAVGQAQLDLRTRRFIQVNRKLCEITGYSEAELLRMSPGDITHPDDRDIDGALFQKFLTGEHKEHFCRKRYVRKDGSVRWVEVSATMVRDEGDRPLRSVGVIQDITEKVKAETGLRSALERVDSVLSSLTEAYFVLDREYRFVEVNPAARRMIFRDMAAEEMIGKGFWEIFPEGVDTEFYSQYQRAMREQVEAHFEARSKIVDRWFEAHAYPRGGRLEVYVRDTTDRRRIEEELRENEERLRLAIDAAQLGTWDWDLLKDRVIWSERIYQFHGLTPEQFAGNLQAPINLVHPEDRERVRGEVEDALAGRRPFSSEVRIVRPDGEVRWVATNGQVFFDAEGKPRRMLGATVDITDRKRAEAERLDVLAREQEARRLAEAANRAKDEFLATLSHELRTPLNAIIGWADLLLNQQVAPTMTRHAIEVINRNAHMQARLIEDLLDVSRIIAGKLQIDPRPVDLLASIHAALDVVRPAASAKAIQFRLDFDAPLYYVLGDETRLQQIVWNLLSNAVKFTPKYGLVKVEVRGCGGAVEVTIRDTGAGIDPTFLPFMFDRFTQADGSRTRAHAGLGLGLAIVRHLVELHGGTIRAASAGKGQGAAVSVRLPLAASVAQGGEADVAPQRNERAARRLQGLRVLVVDDHADTRDMLAALLKAAGAEVRTAASARQGLDSLR